MYKKISITAQTLLYIFMAFMPILPSYFTFGKISVFYYLTAGLALLTLVFFFRGRLIVPHPTSKLLTLFFLIWIFAHSVSMAITEGVLNVFLFLIITFVLFVFLASLINTKEVFIKCLQTIVATSGVVSVFGLIEAVTHFNIFALLNTSGATLNYSSERFGRVRLLSYSWQAIVYGVYLMFCMILALYCIQLLKKGDKKRIFFYVIYALLWANLLLTLSRSSILAAVLANLFFLYFSGFIKMLKIIFIVALCSLVTILILSLLFPGFFEFMIKIYFMMLSLVDDSYSSEIAASFGSNLKAEGNRFELYNWVFNAMKGKWFFGFGQHAQFTHPYKVTNGMYVWTVVKNGIENNYLDTIYRYGLIGAIPEFALYIVVIVYSFTHRAKADWENEVSFNSVIFSMMLAYFLELFAVNQSSDRTIFYLIIMLFLCYNLRGKFQVTEERG